MCMINMNTFIDFINEAALPSNILDWLRNEASTEQNTAAKKVSNWAIKSRVHISGGTSIGKRPQTLILDLKKDGSEIYITTEGEIQFNGEIVETQKDFTAALEKYINSSPELKKYFNR